MVRQKGNQYCVYYNEKEIKCFPFTPGNKTSEYRARARAWGFAKYLHERGKG